MNTIEYLTVHGSLFWPGVVAAVAIALVGGLVSVLIVLKRLAFVGQGVSHAAFGGVGLALAIGAVGGFSVQGAPMAVIVTLFAVLAALGIARLSERSDGRADTAIGIVLAACMAMGFLLYGFAAKRKADGVRLPSIESVLFGDILAAGWTGAWVAIVVLALAVALLWTFWRPLVLWGFDERGARVLGINTERTNMAVCASLAVAIVVAAQLAGVVLATAVFVLPGASALRLSSRLWRVVSWSVALSVLGAVGGIVLAFELDWSIGPSIVSVQCLVYALCRIIGRGKGGVR